MESVGPEQLGEWFDAFGDTMVLYARGWVDAARAEDAVQDVFLRVMNRRRAPENPKAWLFRSVRNAAINEARSQKRRRKREQKQAAGRRAWFESRVENLIDAQAAQDALAALPTEQREIIVLRIWAGMTLQEAAETVNRPISTVHSRYGAGIKAMRERMGVSCKTEKT